MFHSINRFLRRSFVSVILVVMIAFLPAGCASSYHARLTSTGNYTLITAFSPDENDASFESGVLVVSIYAVKEVSATAAFSDETISLTRVSVQTESDEQTENVLYSGSFTLPENETDTALGQVSFTVSDGEITESYYSGILTVKAFFAGTDDGNSVTPPCEPYMNVGSGLVAEITDESAETLNGDGVDDFSRPTNNYLPKGTVDYCSRSVISNPLADKDYRLLRCGRRVNNFAATVTDGNLPESNSVSFEQVKSDGKYTYLSFYTDWKAPFFFSLGDQEYANPAIQNYRIKEATFSYFDLTFCYCTDYADNITFPADHPLFDHSEILYRECDTVLRIYLKEPGKFYGWHAEYDEYDSLVFRFLEPKSATIATNKYGAALYDITILIDAGHGGKDPGAVSGSETESYYNLLLAETLKRELTSIGARVVMTRSNNSDVNAAARTKIAVDARPDLIISVHRNAGGGNGFGCYYFSPFSEKLAAAITESTRQADLYQNNANLWHYFFLNRISDCPAILTENGYITDQSDLENMRNKDYRESCATAIVQGIINYYTEG